MTTSRLSLLAPSIYATLATIGVLFHGGAALAEDAPAAPVEEVVITDKAREHFRAGVNLLQDPDGARYEEAYAQFKAAYAESPSWKILSNLGIAAMKLEKDGEAIAAFEKYLREGGENIPEAEVQQTQTDLQTLKASVVTLNLSTSVPGATLVDERITNRGGNIINQYAMGSDEQAVLKVRPGIHKITARASGYENAVWEVNAQAGSTHEYTFELVKPDPKGGSGTGGGIQDSGTYRPIPLGVWIGLGVTGVLAVGTGVTGAIALGKNGEYDDANNERAENADDLRKGVKSMNLVTDVMLGGAVVAGAVTAVLYITRPEKPRPTALRLDPIVSPQVAALSLSGKF